MSLAELRPAAVPGSVPTAEELVGRARKLAPKLRERALKAERDRQIPLESVAEYIDAGLIHTLQPKRWGGYEHDTRSLSTLRSSSANRPADPPLGV